MMRATGGTYIRLICKSCGNSRIIVQKEPYLLHRVVFFNIKMKALFDRHNNPCRQCTKR